MLALLLTLTLFQQTVANLLKERFAGTEFVLVDAQSGELIASQWPDERAPAFVGSLVKPLLLVAHAGSYPKLRCRAGFCWRPGGHGELDAVHALAESCNDYFEQLAGLLSPEQLASTAQKFGLPAPQGMRVSIGRSEEWPIAPLALLNAYRGLIGNPTIYRGMKLSAEQGTAKELQSRGDLLAKTGTSRCNHSPKGDGDGYVMVMLPAQKPAWALLVRVHGTSGAMAARAAKAMVQVIQEGKARTP
jgi:cell division protein FtsI/penicillin-binding protein 2